MTTREAEFISQLGTDALLFRRLHGREELGRVPEYRLELLRLQTRDAVDGTKLLGTKATVKIRLPGLDQFRYINGWVTRFEQGGMTGRFDIYRVELRPWLWHLSLGADCRIFQDLSALEIIEKVFADYSSTQVEKKLTGSFRKRSYCVQYRESDLAFVSRLMEEEGIYHYFKHSNGQHTLVLCNSASGHQPLADPTLAWAQSVRDDQLREDVITQWQRSQSLTSLKYAHTDFSPDAPSAKQQADATRSISYPKPADLEVFDYPGGYVNLGHDASATGDVTPAAEAGRLAQLRVDAMESAHIVIGGLTPCRTMAAGFNFKFEGHADKGDYLITLVDYEMDYTAYEGIEQRQDDGFGCRFEAVPKATAFQPKPQMPRPLIAGPQTATVVGRNGDEITTDKYGRVKLQFHWDRIGKKDQSSSCWVRVSHPWAGKQFGMVALPRIGDEVVVEFMEGNPDRPLVTGRVYNGENLPPYLLPDHATISGIKTHSSKGGGAANFNELRFEDEKGKEYIWLQAEKDFHRHVKHDAFDSVGNDQWVDITKNSALKIGENFNAEIGKEATLKVGKDVHAGLGADVNVGVTGAFNLKVAEAVALKGTQTIALTSGQAFDIDAGQTLKVSAVSSIHIKGLGIVIDGGTQLTIKAGPSFVTLGPDGVSISGPMVKINSGGSAGAATAAAKAAPPTPKSPAEPKANEDPLTKT